MINSWLLMRNSGGQKTVNAIFEVWEDRNCQSRMLYPAKLSFKIKTENVLPAKLIEKKGWKEMISDSNSSTGRNKEYWKQM